MLKITILDPDNLIKLSSSFNQNKGYTNTIVINEQEEEIFLLLTVRRTLEKMSKGPMNLAQDTSNGDEICFFCTKQFYVEQFRIKKIRDESQHHFEEPFNTKTKQTAQVVQQFLKP